ncbi:MAG TPA: hypothetical protein VGN46_13020 [Luteibacter sp.]|uniref:hypothetical protein n=1 Tax=Luteibacter sp. TaxID=1886636 RepID=UPI002F3E574D
MRTDYLDIDEGCATALLEASSQRHVDAMRHIVAERYPGTLSVRRWEDVESHLRTATLARLEYEYSTGGAVAIRVYHALGGQPLGDVARNAFEGETPGSPESPSSPGWSDSDDPAVATFGRMTDEDVAAMEARDETAYSGFDQTDIRASFRPAGRSVLKPYWHQGRYHAFDAEQKALRAIEEDILDGRMPRGGTVRGLMSGAPCATCRESIKAFADTYDLDITLSGMSPTVPVRVKDGLLASGRARMKGPRLVDVASGRPMVAFDVLAGARDAQVREGLGPLAHERASRGARWQRRSFRLGPPPARAAAGSALGTEPGTDPAMPGPDC